MEHFRNMFERNWGLRESEESSKLLGVCGHLSRTLWGERIARASWTPRLLSWANTEGYAKITPGG